MSHYELDSEELAMIREILEHHLPLAMLGVRDEHFQSLLNGCEKPDRELKVDNDPRNRSRPSHGLVEASRSPLKGDDPILVSAGKNNKLNGL